MASIYYECDLCSRRIKPGEGRHFIVRIEAFAAAGPLEISKEDLAKDHRAEIARTVKQLAERDPDEVEDQIYRKFRYDLCPACHRAFVKDPLRRADAGN